MEPIEQALEFLRQRTQTCQLHRLGDNHLAELAQGIVTNFILTIQHQQRTLTAVEQERDDLREYKEDVIRHVRDACINAEIPVALEGEIAVSKVKDLVRKVNALQQEREQAYKQGVEDAHRCEQRHAQIDQLEKDLVSARAELATWIQANTKEPVNEPVTLAALQGVRCVARRAFDELCKAQERVRIAKQERDTLKAEKGSLYEERNRLRDMLDRINAIPEVADGYHAPNEECIADGVEAVVDELKLAQADLTRLRQEREQYKELWQLRGEALKRPCPNCKYVPSTIVLHDATRPPATKEGI